MSGGELYSLLIESIADIRYASLILQFDEAMNGSEHINLSLRFIANHVANEKRGNKFVSLLHDANQEKML